MTIPRFDDVRDVPLVTDDDVLERAGPLLVHDQGVRWVGAEDLN